MTQPINRPLSASDTDPVPKWWRSLLVAGAAVAVLIGVTQPRAALRSAALIAILAAGIAAIVAVRAVFADIQHKKTTRLARAPSVRPPTVLPTNLSDLLRGYDQSGDLSWSVRSSISALAAERLSLRGLQLRSPEHAPHIRAVISPLMWETVRPSRTGPGGDFVPHAPIPLRSLRTLIDELEAL